MKPASAKSKGRRLQQHVAAAIREAFGLPETDVQSRSMGSGGVDIMMSERALQALPLSIECKSTKGHPGLAALRQSEANKLDGTTSAVCWKPHGAGLEDTLIYQRLSDYLDREKERG